MFFSRGLYVCEKDRSHPVSLQKFNNEIFPRAAIDRFLRARYIHSFISADPGFTETNKALEHLQKTSEKRATILHCQRTRTKKR